MRLLLVLFVLHLTNGQRERAAVYLGRGYDVIKGNPFILRPGDGAASSQHIDPGMKSAMVLKMVGVALSDVQMYRWNGIHRKCLNNSKFITSGPQFQHTVLSEMFSNAEDWHGSLQNNAIGGDNRTHDGKYPENRIFVYEYEKCVSNKRYISKKMTTPDFNNSKSGYDEFTIEGVTDDFRRSVCELPDQYKRGDPNYPQLISSFGTSVIFGTNLGTMNIGRYKIPRAAINEQFRHGEPVIRYNHTTETNEMYIRITDQLLSKIDPKVIEDQNNTRSRWAIGNDYYLSPVELSLWNLDDVIHEDYWPNCRNTSTNETDENPSANHCCARLATLRENVKLALQDYPEQLHTHLTNATDVLYPVRWPSGTYSLYQSNTGCPGETGFKWRTGYILQAQGDATQIESPTGAFTNYVALDRDINIKRLTLLSDDLKVFLVSHGFCTKADDDINGDDDSKWPPGSYCVYKVGKCPQGFEEGWVYWDDFRVRIRNRLHGAYPDGVYDQNTQIYFCCRKDGPASHPIILPVHKSFILMRLGGTCQSVQWTKVTEASITYDGHWGTSWFPLSHFVGGLHPDNDVERSNNKLYYCNYEYKTP